jgi:hypothetical protein
MKIYEKTESPDPVSKGKPVVSESQNDGFTLCEPLWHFPNQAILSQPPAAYRFLSLLMLASLFPQFARTSIFFT